MKIKYDDDWKVGLPIYFICFPGIRATTYFKSKKYAGLGETKKQAKEHLLEIINKLRKNNGKD